MYAIALLLGTFLFSDGQSGGYFARISARFGHLGEGLVLGCFGSAFILTFRDWVNFSSRQAYVIAYGFFFYGLFNIWLPSGPALYPGPTTTVGWLLEHPGFIFFCGLAAIFVGCTAYELPQRWLEVTTKVVNGKVWGGKECEVVDGRILRWNTLSLAPAQVPKPDDELEKVGSALLVGGLNYLQIHFAKPAVEILKFTLRLRWVLLCRTDIDKWFLIINPMMNAKFVPLTRGQAKKLLEGDAEKYQRYFGTGPRA
jgi:hypothetical protein